MQCLRQLLAPLSPSVGQTPQATVDTIYEMNKLARKATVWARTPLKVHAHHSLVVVTYTDAGWTTRPDGTSQGGQLVFISNSQLLQSKESNMSLISWHSSRLRRWCSKVVICSQRLKQRQTAMTKLSAYVCAYKKFCSDSLICKTCNLKRDKFLLLRWWTVVASTTPWLALRPLVFA